MTGHSKEAALEENRGDNQNRMICRIWEENIEVTTQLEIHMK